MHGQDKSALPIGGETILDRQLTMLRTLTTDLLIVGGQAVPAAPEGVRVGTDRVPDSGPLGGLDAALAHASAPYVLIVACDMPFVSRTLLEHLAMRVQGWDAAVPRTIHGYHPLCAAYAKTIAPIVRQRLDAGELAMVGLLHELRLTEVGPD